MTGDDIILHYQGGQYTEKLIFMKNSLGDVYLQNASPKYFSLNMYGQSAIYTFE